MQGTCCRSISDRHVNNPAPARDVIAVVEQEVSGAAAEADVRAAAAGVPASSNSSSSSQEPKYKALLAIILKLIEQEQQQQQEQQEQQKLQQQEEQQQQQPARWQRLEAFLRAQPTATSIPFIGWLADLEAGASGAYKAQLAQLCEVLVVLREQQDREGQEALYADTLALLSGGDEQALALMSADPKQYALALAEGMTGQPLQLQGYGPAYDALLQVAPAAALTPEAVAAGHQMAEELAADLTSRRKSTVAAMLGRVQLDSLSQEQQAALLGPSPAARILDLLLSMPSSGDRLALLPDCFTPPPQPSEPEATAAAAAAAAAAGGGVEEEGETDELWCTPMQLLNEIDRRLNAAAAGEQPAGSSAVQALPAGNSSSSSSNAQAAALEAPGDAGSEEAGLFGEELAAALQELREHIQQQWLESLPTTS